MATSKHSISRRAMLRGILGGSAVALALPPLEAMFNANGEALASGAPIPKRLGLWFWGNGVRRNHWTPDGEGTVWTPKAETAPLAALNDSGKKCVSIIGGFDCPIDGSAHHKGRGQVLTGTYDANKGTYGNPTGPSIDQIAAEHFWADEATRPLHKFLAVGISRRGKANSTSNGGTSRDSSGSGIAAEFSPKELFNRLFSTAVAGDPQAASRLELRKSILDVVSQDTEAFRKRLGKYDQGRLDAHLSSIRELELTLDGSVAQTCSVPSKPGDFGKDLNHEPLKEINAAMAKVLAMGIACDLTRAFSYQFTQMQADTLFWMDPINATEGGHVMTHDDRPVPKNQKKDPQPEKTHKSVVYQMECFATLLQELKNIPEGASNVLDNCLIYGTSEVAEGTSHSTKDMPIVLAGTAGGVVKSGLHYRAGGQNIAKLLLTCVRAVGVNKSSLGSGQTQTTESVKDLLV